MTTVQNKKISQLTAATSINPADLVPIVQGGVNKKVTNIVGLQSNGALVIDPVNGNTRGVKAIDLQQERTAVDKIASGLQSIIAGGKSNKASGDFSTAAGYDSTASGNYSIAAGNTLIASGEGAAAFGASNTASGYWSTAAGYGNTASGKYSVAAGYHSIAGGNNSTAIGNIVTASGQNSQAFGSLNTASGDYSHVYGKQTTASGYASSADGKSATADKWGQVSHSNAGFVATGDNQYSTLEVSRHIASHTDQTWFDLYLDSASTTHLITIPTNGAWTVEVLIIGSTTSAAQLWAYKVQGTVKNIAGTITVAFTVTNISEADAAYDVQLAADNTNHALLIQVRRNGGADHDIYWNAKVSTVEVIHA